MKRRCILFVLLIVAFSTAGVKNGKLVCVVAVQGDPITVGTYTVANNATILSSVSLLPSSKWYGIGGDWRLYHLTTQNPGGTPLTIDQLLQAWQQDINNHQKQYGFNVARLAFSFADSGGVTHNVLNNELDYVLDLFSNNGIRVILDLHNWVDMPGFFGSFKWLADWTTLAQRYKNDSRILAYELFNEPFGTNNPQGTIKIDNWDSSVMGGGCGVSYNNVSKSVRDALAQCVDAIRSTGDNHTIIYPDPWYFNVGDELAHPEGFNCSIDNRPNIVITFHDWFESPTIQTESSFLTWWNNVRNEMTLWKNYFPIWIGEFGMSLTANNIDFQRKVNVEIINWAVTNHVGFSMWTARSNPAAMAEQWDLNDGALQASIFSSNVTLVDLSTLAMAYASKPGDPNWNPNADLNGDGLVDLLDLIILAQHYK